MDKNRNTPASIAIVTDSTADIPQALVNRYNIRVIPNVIMIQNESLEDGVDITREEFYERLITTKAVTTGTASSGKYEETYAQLLDKGYQHILSVHAASLLSGIFNAASLAAQSFGEHVTVIDSKQLTLGLGFQVLAAAEEIAIGASLEKVVARLQDVAQRVRLIAMLDTLEYVRRSGRVSWARARMGELLRIKPFIEVKDGKVVSLGEARTTQKGILRLKEMLLALGPIERLAILHTNAEDQAHRFLQELPETPPDPFLVNVTTVIGTHTGPNGIGFTAVLA